MKYFEKRPVYISMIVVIIEKGGFKIYTRLIWKHQHPGQHERSVNGSKLLRGSGFTETRYSSSTDPVSLRDIDIIVLQLLLPGTAYSSLTNSIYTPF
jgi:hypothetical protein